MAVHLQIITICAGIIAYALVSQRLERTLLTMPMLFVGFGYLLGSAGTNILDVRVGANLHIFAEFTLVLILFTDAASVRFAELRAHYGTPLRMLLIGMPLTMLLGTLVAHWVSPEAPWVLAFLVAALLTPTDAALGQSILSSPKVPAHIRRTINVESGLNDGLAVPVIMLGAFFAAHVTGTDFHEQPSNLYSFVALQLTLGPIIGILTGAVLAYLLDAAIAREMVTGRSRGIAVLAGALLSFALADSVGGNGFIAAFLAGLTLGNRLKSNSEFIFEFMESEGQILTMLTFIIFGAVLMPVGLEHASWKTLVLALAFLSVVRMLPVWLSLIGTGLPASHKLSLGWFGPRGLASILFVLLIDEQFDLPGFNEVLACVVLTVLLSVVLHGASAAPVADWFGRRQSGQEED